MEPRFEWADAMSLPYPDDRFDAATVAFGARNFEDLGRGLSEMARVVRPGGRVVVLEMTTPTRAPLSLFYGLWFDRLVPALGRLAGVLARAARGRRARAGEAIGEAYSYLPSSVKRFPEPAELAAEMGRAGIVGVGGVLLAGGIVAIHAGTVARRAARRERRRAPRPPTSRRRWTAWSGSCAAAATACASGWPASSATSSTSPPRRGSRWRGWPTRP